ncbi:class IV adenylate cyclase [Planctomycetota bacterium]|nr:class IV adenylate cyclase [Planctomycetota bacterium]
MEPCPAGEVDIALKGIDVGHEIEAKMKLTDREAIEEKLRKLDGEFVCEIFEINTYFDTPTCELKQKDEGLRIRIEQHCNEAGDEITKKVVMTHKGAREGGELKSRMENEVVIEHADSGEHLINGLGYEAVLRFEKRRKRWKFYGCLIELDELPLIGQFIEIEGKTDEVIYEARKKLGLDHEALITTSYIAMLIDAVDQSEFCRSELIPLTS